MFCNQCGNQVQEGTRFCPACGNEMRGNTKEQNLFSDLMVNKTQGNYMELGMWIANCVCLVLVFVAVLGCTNTSELGRSFRYQWIFLLLLVIGQNVLMLLRLRPVLILYDIFWFFLFRIIPMYSVQSKMGKGWIISYDTGVLLLLFITTLLLGTALFICACIHFFSAYDLGKVVIILAGCCWLFILMFAVYSYAGIIIKSGQELGDYINEFYRTCKNGFGTVSYLIISLQSGLYIAAFFMGWIRNDKQKLRHVQVAAPAVFQPQSSFQEPVGDFGYNSSTAASVGQGMDRNQTEDFDHTVLLQGMNQAAMPQQNMIGMQGIVGFCQGQTFPIQGEVIVGSQSGSVHILVRDSFVSRRHCCIRYNDATGCYEVKDMSSNGVFLSDGTRLPKGEYISCPRRTVLFIGSNKQQFSLL